ncbi:sensor domain-containing diguanylate cyclase, partial [Psychromonas sp. MB-3u-54]|uniref:GAF domain-containing protein n=1 Tax=Psychromonas sp. MB-3u-54 TaxID=2058319 RepID=UPI000CC9FC69
MNNASSTDENKFLLDNPEYLISLTKWQKTINLLAEIFNTPTSFLVQYTNKGFQATICSQHKDNPVPVGNKGEDLDADVFCRKVVESGQELYVNDALADPRYKDCLEVTQLGVRSYLGVPVLWPSGTPFGTLCVMDNKITDY